MARAKNKEQHVVVSVRIPISLRDWVCKKASRLDLSPNKYMGDLFKEAREKELNNGITNVNGDL